MTASIPLVEWKFFVVIIGPVNSTTGGVTLANSRIHTCWAPTNDAAVDAVRRAFEETWPHDVEELSTELISTGLSMAQIVARSPLPGQTVEVMTPVRDADGLIVKSVVQSFSVR